MNFKKFLGIVAKNLIAFIVGSLGGIISGVLFAVYVWLPQNAPCTTPDCNPFVRFLGMLVFGILGFGLLGLIIGTLISLILVNLIRSKKQKQG